jgi:hypothetical protein
MNLKRSTLVSAFLFSLMLTSTGAQADTELEQALDLESNAAKVCRTFVIARGDGTAYECYCNYGTACVPPARTPHCEAQYCGAIGG